jgi:hypothetical protein
MEARRTVKENCRRIYIDLEPHIKYNLLPPPFNLYDWGWDVHYWLSDNSDFGVIIDT